MNAIQRTIPWAMASARAALGPVMILGAACRWNGITMAAMVIVALVSDIFDGVFARRWHCDTAAVRLFDTIADTIFYLCTGFALWLVHPAICRANATLLAIVFAAEVIRYAFDLLKFGKPASYHSYLAKTWGLFLAAGVITAFCSGASGPLRLGLLVGVLNQIEGALMSLLLPVWTRDVKHLAAAWRLRQPASPSRTLAVKAIAVALFATVMLPMHAGAAEIDGIRYTGASLPVISPGTSGTLDESPAKTLILRYPSSGKVPAGQIAIDYERVIAFHYSNEVLHKLGVLPTIAVALVGTRLRHHSFSISYRDQAEAVQVIQFEAPASQSTEILELLRSRSPQVCGKNDYRCGKQIE